jgi:hypothetical protein
VLVADKEPLAYWVNFIADLALEKRLDSPLVADAFRCRPLSLRSDFRPPIEHTDEDRAALAAEPHFICLPSDVFQASAWATDLLLHDTDRSTPSSQPTPPLDTAQPVVPKQSPSPETESRKNARRRRDEGKDDRCVGVYLKYLESNETPPGPTVIAAEVGCHPSTASRAIKKWEDKRLEMAQEAARERQALHNDEEN